MYRDCQDLILSSSSEEPIIRTDLSPPSINPIKLIVHDGDVSREQLSCVALSEAAMLDANLLDGDIVLVSGKRRKRTLAKVQIDAGLERTDIRLSADQKSNLR